MKKEGCHEDYAQSPYEIALSYVSQSFETLEQIIGQPVKSEMPPNCQEQGEEALYKYALFINFNEHAKESMWSHLLHCHSKKQYTAGCMAIDRKLMNSICRLVNQGL